MKKIFIFLSLLTFVLSSCDRSGIFEEFDKATPYEFHVIACENTLSSTGFPVNALVPISGVNVQLFRTAADRTAGAPVYASGTTGADGKAIFTEAILNPNKNVDAAKGIYYLRLTKAGLQSADATTRYLLINDGHTHQWVRMVKP